MSTPATDALLDECKKLVAFKSSSQEDAASAPPPPKLIAATRAFVIDVVQSGSLPPEVLEGLQTLAPHEAAWLAVSVGSAAEQGLDPALAGPTLVEVFRDWFDRTADGQDPARLDALPTLAQALVAHLARLDGLRLELGSDTALTSALEAREGDSHAIAWVRELIARRSGDLFVVHADARRVVHLRFENVARCFHLFSLLQSVLGSALPGGRRPDEGVASAARGQADEPVTDSASWHFQRAGAKPSMANAVWGEESVDALKGPDGAYAVSLWEPLLGERRWSSTFFGPPLEAAPSDMRFIAELKDAEAAPWLERVLA